MFKLASSKSLAQSLEKLVLLSSTSTQQTRSVRLRKPPWLPRAKNKMFRVPPLAQVDHEELAYIKPIWNEYKAQMRSVYQLFKTENKFSAQASLKVQQEKERLLEREAQIMAENEKVNAEILQSQLRDSEIKLAQKKRQVEEDFKRKMRINQLFHQEAESQVRKLKEKAKRFIDQENLEYEIEKALSERSEYNFAIDFSGLLYKNKVVVSHEQAFDPRFVPVKRASLTPVQTTVSSLPETASKAETPNTPPTLNHQ